LCDINLVLHTVLDRFNETLQLHRITVETNLITAPPLIAADRENLTKAIANIAENAVEAMLESEKKILRITTLTTEASLDIRIADTGKGIEKSKIKNIYDPFFTSKTYGPGLGLTFALKAIQSHQGRISVESEEGVGTIFTISLPLRKRLPD
jgi:signal transduction histidine kinase